MNVAHGPEENTGRQRPPHYMLITKHNRHPDLISTHHSARVTE